MMGREDLPSVYGLFNFLLGIGIVTIPVITGSLVDSFGTFRAPFRFLAVVQVVATVVLGASIFINKTNRAKYADKRTSA